MSRRAALRRWVGYLRLAGCALAVASCDALTGPPPGPNIYVLASIAGTRVDSSLNYLALCLPTYAAEGADLRLLGDTLLLFANGRAAYHTHQRSRPPDIRITTDPDSISFYDASYTFRYFRRGRVIQLFGESYDTAFNLVDDGALENNTGAGACGPWRYERISSSAP